MKQILLLLITASLLNGCSVLKNYALKPFISPKYKSIAFSEDNIPASPDYSSDKSWAVLPSKYPKQLTDFIGNIKASNAAVFYIYPTLLLDPKDVSWNSDIYKKQIREDVINKAVKYQASAWASAGELYVPFYRQAHIRIFTSPYDKEGEKAWELAYLDLKQSFEYFLKHHRKNRPIIIASHSQGTIHAKRLLQEYFDGTDLQNELVAAYLVGAQIKIDDFKFLRPLNSFNETGGYVSWNTFKKNKYPKKYDKWFEGGVTTNPINWDSKKASNLSEHLGLLYIDDKIYPKSVKVVKKNGILWTSLPKVPNRIFLSLIKSYHYADINLFWADIQKNSIDRLNAWVERKNNL